jgi:hypothetical protein
MQAIDRTAAEHGVPRMHRDEHLLMVHLYATLLHGACEVNEASMAQPLQHL